jgi:hypothetical protein
VERLQQRDFTSLLGFVLESYALRNHEDFVTYLLTSLPRLVPAEAVSYSDMDPQSGKSDNRVSPSELGTLANHRLWELHMHEHPVLAHNVRTGDGQAMAISDFWSQRQFRSRGLYCELYHPGGAEDSLCFTLPCRPSHVIGIALHRDRWRVPERDKLVVNLLRPHLIQAWRNARKVTPLHGRLTLLSTAMESVELGVIILDGAGRTRWRRERWRHRATTAEGIEDLHSHRGRHQQHDQPADLSLAHRNLLRGPRQAISSTTKR